MAGQASARAKGKLGGRPKILDDKKKALAKTMHNNKDISVKKIFANVEYWECNILSIY
jgi:DNA invertase Pin-like site-specific DNA recombinase